MWHRFIVRANIRDRKQRFATALFSFEIIINVSKQTAFETFFHEESVARIMYKTDPLFGPMKFRRSYFFFGGGFWVGNVHFTPINREIEISITAGRSGISDEHRNFYRDIESQFNNISESAHDVLYDILIAVNKTFFSDYTREEVFRDIKLYYIFISSLKEKQPEWGISFMYEPWKESYSVHFEGWKPLYGQFDD